jgi:hypothetical protein
MLNHVYEVPYLGQMTYQFSGNVNCAGNVKSS